MCIPGGVPPITVSSGPVTYTAEDRSHFLMPVSVAESASPACPCREVPWVLAGR